MPLQPLNDRILAQRIKLDERTKGGIIIPETAKKDKPVEAIVMAVGTGIKNADGEPTELAVKVGERILFGKYAGTEVTVDGEDFLILNEDDIFAVIDL